MSRAILGFILLLAASAAHADNYYQTLQSWYGQGQPVTYNQLRGFYSGRCFEVNEQEVPRNTMLGYLEIRDGRDPGPGLPPPMTDARLNVLMWRGQPADVFDNDRMYPNNRRALEDVTARSWPTIGAPYEMPTLGFNVDWEPNGNPDIQVDFVSYQTYYVSRATALINQRYLNGWTGQVFNARAGDVLTMCYYFKLLGN